MLKSNLKNIIGKKILIIGLGKSGIAAAQALITLGGDVTIQDNKDKSKVEPQLLSYFDSKNIKYYLNEVPEDMTVFDMLVLSPGVPPNLDFIKEAKNSGAEI